MEKTAIPKQLASDDPVIRLVRRAPVIVHLDTTLRACARVMAEESIAGAAREMLRNEIRHLAVARGERTVGLISMRDLLAVRAGPALH